MSGEAPKHIRGIHELREALKKHNINTENLNLRSPRIREILNQLLDKLETTESRLQKVEVAKKQLETTLVQLREENSIDPQTGLPNRNTFEKELGKMIARRNRRSKSTPPTPVTIALIDVNDLALINKNYTHPGGDAAIEHVANILQKNMREGDIIGRRGAKSDEFCIALYNATSEQAEAFIGRIADEIKNTPCMYNTQQIPVSVAFGVQELGPEQTVDDIVGQASSKMYEHKLALKSQKPYTTRLQDEIPGNERAMEP